MARLTVSLLSMLLIATVGLGWAFDHLYNEYNNKDSTHDQVIELVSKIGIQLATTLNSSEDPETLIQSWPLEEHYQVSITPVNEVMLPPSVMAQLESGEPVILESQDKLSFNFYLSQQRKVLTLDTPVLTSHDSNATRFTFTALFYIGLMLLIFLWLWPLLRRLLLLSKKSRHLGEGDLSQRIEVSSLSYIKNLELDFNRMAQKIETQVADIKLLSSAVSHDLRTPLARIQFGLDTLRETTDEAKREIFAEKISKNVEEMTDLIESLLTYARLDQLQLEVEVKPVDLRQLIQHCLDQIEPSEIEVHLKPSNQDNHINGHKKHLMMLVNNLLSNALRYAQSRIVITLIKDQQGLHLSIEDDGPGIEPALRDEVLKPFIRDQNNAKPGGYGIGLAAVKRITERHQANLSIASSAVLNGAKISITF